MKATMKNVTLDEYNEDLITFAQTIDFTELFDHVKNFANAVCEFYQLEITTTRGDVYIRFMSDDIAPQTGPFASILRNCCLASLHP